MTAKGSKTFKEYVMSRRPADDHMTGDFIKEAKFDTKFPNIKTWREMRGYLVSRGAAHEMFVAARTVWRDYQRTLKGAFKRRL